MSRPAIAAPVPSRLTIALPLPRHGGVLRAFVALGEAAPGIVPAPVRLRIGVSDHRIYEGLFERLLAPGHTWSELRVDLSAYAGWKWSLFYRPERMTWRVVLATDATGAPPTNLFWGSPEIVTDSQAAREYSARRQRLR